MAWRFHFPIRNYDFKEVLLLGVFSHHLGTPEWFPISLFHVVLSNTSSTFNATVSTYLLQEYFPSCCLSSSSSLSWYWSIYQSSDHAPFVRSVDMSEPLKPFLRVSCVTGPMFPDRLTMFASDVIFRLVLQSLFMVFRGCLCLWCTIHQCWQVRSYTKWHTLLLKPYTHHGHA